MHATYCRCGRKRDADKIACNNCLAVAAELAAQKKSTTKKDN